MPISLLPTISLRVIFKQLYKFFLDNKLLYDSRYGFREGHSTEYDRHPVTFELYLLLTQEGSNVSLKLNVLGNVSLWPN